MVLLLGYAIGLDATFGSEFVKPLEFLSASVFDIDVWVLSPIGEMLRHPLRKAWAARLQSFPPTVRGHIRRIPMAPSRFITFTDEACLLALALRISHEKNSQLILHAVGARAAYLAVRARLLLPHRKISVVFRSTGPAADEFLYRAGGLKRLTNQRIKHRHKSIQYQEDAAYRAADAVVALSEPMRQHAILLRGGPSNVRNIGCYADVSMFSRDVSQRENIRRELGWMDELIILHSGSLHPWQRPAEIIRLFEQILSLEPRSRLVMLTRDSRVLDSALSHSSLPRDKCSTFGLEFAEVPRYLAAADIGLIGRGLMEAPSIVNSFSSPIKFAEYLASGCPVIMGEGIGDFSELAKAQELGLVLDHEHDDTSLRVRLGEFLNSYRNNQELWRQRCLRFAETHLDVRLSIDRYQALYADLVELRRP